VGTIGTGTWQGTAINRTYLTGQSGTNTGDEIAASLTAAGVIEIATTAEVNTGSDDTRAVSPVGLTAWTGDTAIVTTGALDAGSITSNFGTINTGSSAITTTGAITGGSLVIGSANIIEAELEALDALARGSIIYGNASAATATLTKGDADQVLTSDGTDISWEDAGGGSLSDLSIANHDSIVINSDGIALNSEQVAFKVRPNDSVTQSNVTGDSTAYTIIQDNQTFDQNSDHDGTSTFTAPVTGRYWLGSCIFTHGTTASHDEFVAKVVTSNDIYFLVESINLNVASATQGIITGSCFVDMDASDTATIVVDVSGSGRTVDIASDTFFWGFLVC